ncbi:branched-chain amino acid ABC transporter permease [uncultured Roseovarius sp.]|uniref:branched-chain amino acid ABC transporter permease n=1 Tax=uncultured Roseovarius sp. TaxID=293344 RepID=UPI0026185B2C|nr:branched-chain amino acid ABC transporter permease [uncultured Roseovarius sp.]
MLKLSLTQWIGAGVFFAAVFVVAPVTIAVLGRTDLFYTLTSVGLLAIASAGVWLTFYIGRINIGQGAFALLGAYVSAILVTKAGMSFWISLPIAGLFAAFVAVLIGLPILRLKGVYFAMITLVLTQVFTLTALALPITNGAKGITSIPLPGELSVLGLTLIPDFATLDNPRQAFYYTTAVLMVLTFAAMYRLVNSRLGHLCRSMQQNEELASSIGVNIAYIRIVIYAIASFFGGVGGAMFGSIAQSVYPSSFQVADSVNFMLNCFLGGLGYVFGPMLGTFVLYFGWDLLFEFGKYQMLIYSSVLIFLILVLPNGLLSLRLSKKRGQDK